MMCVIYNECLSFITQSHIQQATTPPLSSPSGCLCGRQTDAAKIPRCRVRNPRGGRGQDAGANRFCFRLTRWWQKCLQWEKCPEKIQPESWRVTSRGLRQGVARWGRSSASFLLTPPQGTKRNSGCDAGNICACRCCCCFPKQSEI